MTFIINLYLLGIFLVGSYLTLWQGNVIYEHTKKGNPHLESSGKLMREFILISATLFGILVTSFLWPLFVAYGIIRKI